jgi:hypothetical protein
MHSDKELMEIAESTSLPTAMRLFMLASARSNRWGHAAFGRKEIRETLGVSYPTCKAAIGSLIAGKVAAPDSTYRCVVLSAALVRRNDRAYQTCIEEEHVKCQRLMWIAGIGWETREGEWHQAVNSPEAPGLVARRTTRTRRVVEETETVEEIAVAPSDWQRQHYPNLPKIQNWAPGSEDPQS